MSSLSKFYELSIAWKYLLPKRRQLSVSIISLISILVISLVIWLILVFFSVSRGLEKGWIEKLTSLTAPVRVTPTEKYYSSYYYQIDKLSNSSNYAARSIGEKLLALKSDPYNPEEDEELPRSISAKDRDTEGQLKDLVKQLYSTQDVLKGYPGLRFEEFAFTGANLKLKLIRGLGPGQEPTQAFLTQSIYLGSNDAENGSLNSTLLKPSEEDRTNQQRQPAQTGAELVLVPKSFRDVGVLLGDRGEIAYYAPSVSSIQEQRLPVQVAGFYDPGIVPLGGRFVLASPEFVQSLRAMQQQEESLSTNGVNVRLANLEQAEAVKSDLERELQRLGIAPYWKVETFREYDYAKDLLQQLNSEKHIFGLISLVILIVACSNIISMLIILVNNKKVEIGILRSMGATSKSIAAIFGLCGMTMGLIGTFIGTLLALLTLNNLNGILGLISRLQGYDAFNPMFYGETLPNQLSVEVLMVVLTVTGVLSLVSGLVPALKASKVKPAEILRSEG
ncbi:MAG: ABC transporter permease [Parachlamydiaceae bacterium]